MVLKILVDPKGALEDLISTEILIILKIYVVFCQELVLKLARLEHLCTSKLVECFTNVALNSVATL